MKQYGIYICRIRVWDEYVGSAVVGWQGQIFASYAVTFQSSASNSMHNIP